MGAAAAGRARRGTFCRPIGTLGHVLDKVDVTMAGFLRRLRPRDLFASWAVYWLLLSLQLVPAVSAIWRATHAQEKGNVTASVGDWIMSLTVTVGGQTTWTGSRHMLSLALLIAGPPLALWLLWVSQRPRRVEMREPA